MVWAVFIIYTSTLSSESLSFLSATSNSMITLESLLSLYCFFPGFILDVRFLACQAIFPGLLFCPITTDSKHSLIYSVTLQQQHCQASFSLFHFEKKRNYTFLQNVLNCHQRRSPSRSQCFYHIKHGKHKERGHLKEEKILDCICSPLPQQMSKFSYKYPDQEVTGISQCHRSLLIIVCYPN